MYDDKEYENMPEPPRDPADELPEIPVSSTQAEDSAAAAASAGLPAAPAAPRRSVWQLFAAALALVAMGAGVGSATTFSLSKRFQMAGVPIGMPAVTQSSGAKVVVDAPFANSNTIANVYKRLSPAVVKIAVSTSRNAARGGQSSGSGFVVDPKGYVLTNHHVVNGAAKIEVSFVDGTTLSGTVVGSDRYRDLAVVKVDTGNRPLVAAPLGNSDDVEVGELAIAIGSPFGHDYTVTAGIISGLNREILEEDSPFPIPGALQTDAAINPGNSGGPLLNAAGEVIGINTAIESPLRGSVGIGFAVPINAAKEILPTLISGQKVQYPWLGISMRDLSPAVAENIGTPVTEGALVQDISRGSPAAIAGIKPVGTNRRGEIVSADVIVELDGKPIKDSQDVMNLIQTKKVGDTLSITVLRGKERLTLSATLSARPDQISFGDEDE